MPKRTYQPHKRQRQVEHGFRKRNSSVNGRKVLARRRIKGRARLTAQSLMISRKYRFHSRGGVRYTYKNGKTIRESKISLVFAPNSRNKQRYAVVVSKKVLKSAVGRNRIRRRVYEVIREQLPKISQPVDCIFVVYSKEVATMEYKELRSLMVNLLKEANIL